MNDNIYLAKLMNYLNLESELDDMDVIHQTIVKDIALKGTNLWILVFAIIIASVGLNMNSTAVIIGAMLISPLMGPINGMGYSIATYNYPLFKRALKSFNFAVLSSLIASTIYFSISPISTAHSELLARTSPTIYDVLIALFGGLAGIVAMSSKQKGNVIPGVAIATALMPPLCTAGYGLATGQFYYFFGAFYLFTINTVFIALSAMVISQILKFPIRTILDPKLKKKVNSYISFIIILVLVPSIYFGYNLVQKDKFISNANQFIQNIGVIDGNYLLKSEIHPEKNSITLIYAGTTLDDIQKASILDKSKNFSLKDLNIKFEQGLSFDIYDDKNIEVINLKDEINKLNQTIREKEEKINTYKNINVVRDQLNQEIKSLFPIIKNSIYTQSEVIENKKSKKVDIVVFTLNKNTLSTQDRNKIYDWIKVKLDSEVLKIYYE